MNDVMLTAFFDELQKIAAKGSNPIPKLPSVKAPQKTMFKQPSVPLQATNLPSQKSAIPLPAMPAATSSIQPMVVGT